MLVFERGLIKALKKFDDYLNIFLLEEIDVNIRGDDDKGFRRKFLDGDELILVDCNLLFKFYVVKVRDFYYRCCSLDYFRFWLFVWTS